MPPIPSETLQLADIVLCGEAAAGALLAIGLAYVAWRLNQLMKPKVTILRDFDPHSTAEIVTKRIEQPGIVTRSTTRIFLPKPN